MIPPLLTELSNVPGEVFIRVKLRMSELTEEISILHFQRNISLLSFFFFKEFLTFIIILLLFYILVFWPQGMWELSSLNRGWSVTPALKVEGLTTGPAGKSQFCYLYDLLTYKGWKVQGHVFTHLALPGTLKPAVRLKSIPWRLTSPVFLSLEPVIPLHTTVLIWTHSPPIHAPLSGNFTLPLVDHMRKLCLWTFKTVVVQSPSHVRFFATPCTAACQALHPSLSPEVYSNSCPLNRWCHPSISSSALLKHWWWFVH